MYVKVRDNVASMDALRSLLELLVREFWDHFRVWASVLIAAMLAFALLEIIGLTVPSQRELIDEMHAIGAASLAAFYLLHSFVLVCRAGIRYMKGGDDK